MADHHVAFGGTFTFSLSTYHVLLRDLCRSILTAGFRRIVLVNSHGGNISALAALAVELTRELDAPIAAVTYVMEAADAVASLLQHQANVMHAWEGETAMMMALAPDLVDTARLDAAHGPAFDVAASSAASRRPIVGWLRPSARAAPPNVPARTIARKTRTSFQSTSRPTILNDHRTGTCVAVRSCLPRSSVRSLRGSAASANWRFRVRSSRISTMHQVAILDDYQRAAPASADWSAVQSRANVTVFDDHLDDKDAWPRTSRARARLDLYGGSVEPAAEADRSPRACASCRCRSIHPATAA